MSKKNIAIVATSAAIGSEKGLNRMYYLAELLAKNGYNVEFITSDFQHWTKSHRDDSSISKNAGNCKITLLHEIGYKKNVDPKRVVSHYMLACNIKKYLKTKSYDLIYCDLPDNHVSVVCAKYAKKRGIPFVADIEDLWPKAMEMAFNIPIVSNILFSYFSRDAKKTYQLSSAIVGSSDTYRDDPLKYGIKVPKSITVYVGNDLNKFDKAAKEYGEKIEKDKKEFWITYAGTLGTSYDIKTLLEAAGILKKMGETDIKIMILGDGPLRKEFEEISNICAGKVYFAGYLPFDEMVGYLVNSDVVINSVKKNAPQSIVSKIGDYLAAGIPMINTCVDKEFWQKVETDQFGVNVMPENVDELVEKIIWLKNNKEECEKMGNKARIIAENEFNRADSFLRIKELIDELV